MRHVWRSVGVGLVIALGVLTGVPSAGADERASGPSKSSFGAADVGYGATTPLAPSRADRDNGRVARSTWAEFDTSESDVKLAAVCPQYVNLQWTFYGNGSARMQIVWNPAGMLGNVVTRLAGVQVPESTPAALGVQQIDVLTSDWDGGPAGYALTPSQAVGWHQFSIQAKYVINGSPVVCSWRVYFWALPPPMDVSLSGPAIEGSGNKLLFDMWYPVLKPTRYSLEAPSRYCYWIDSGGWGWNYCFGGTATPGDDYTNLPESPIEIEIPADTTHSERAVFYVDDQCREGAETIQMGWVFVDDLDDGWGVIYDGFLGNPTFQYSIAEPGDVRDCPLVADANVSED
mgnify:CR=1 FL=1